MSNSQKFVIQGDGSSFTVGPDSDIGQLIISEISAKKSAKKKEFKDLVASL